MRSKFTLPKIMSAASAARLASSASCTRPSTRSCTRIEALDAEREPVHTRGEVARELLPLERPGIGLQRDLGRGQERQPRANARQQAIDRRGREQAGRAAAEEHAHDLAAPHVGQGELEIAQQRIDVGVLGNLAARLVRIEVAIGTLLEAPRQVHVQRQRRQHGENGSTERCDIHAIHRDRSCASRNCASSERSARPRCDTSFLRPSGISAPVMPVPSISKWAS